MHHLVSMSSMINGLMCSGELDILVVFNIFII